MYIYNILTYFGSYLGVVVTYVEGSIENASVDVNERW